jgi:hypothetical protein
MAHKEDDTQLLLQLMDVSAEGWLRDVQALGRFGHAQSFSHGDEGLHSSQIHVAKSYIKSVYQDPERCIGQHAPCGRAYRRRRLA